MAWLVPGDDTTRRLHAALAHETNHNVRFQYQKWHDDITLGEMIVSEEKDGSMICEKIHEALDVQGA